MTLTEDYIKQVEDAAKAYDAAADLHDRVVLGARFDSLTDCLSEGQAKQVARRLMRI